METAPVAWAATGSTTARNNGRNGFIGIQHYKLRQVHTQPRLPGQPISLVRPVARKRGNAFAVLHCVGC
jgi:hypothetical protein